MGVGSDDLTIKLVLDAINKMGPELEQGVKQIGQLTESVDKLKQHSDHMQSGMKTAMNGSLLDPKTWDALMKNQQAFQMRMDMLQQSGFNKMMVGGAILAPVIGMVKAAGDMGAVMDQIKIDIYDSSLSSEEWASRMKLLRDTTVDLSREVKYGSAEIGDAVDNLVRGNVAVQDVADGAARAAVYLAQASKGEISTGQSAEAVAQLGNAWQLTGKQLENVADSLARVDAASTASIPSLLEGFKYVSSSASNLKIPVQDVAVALGVLNNSGIDASTAGTTLNMMLQNLQPTTKAAKDMFEAMGLSVKNNPFYDVNGKLKPMVEIIRILRNATADMTDQQKQLAFRTLFDERGSRAVINLIKEGKNSYEDIESSLGRQMSLWDRIKTQNQGMNAQLDILKGNLTTLFGESGSPVSQQMTDFLKNANNIVVALTEWTQANPEATSGILKTTAAVGGLTAGLGALEVALAGIMKAWKPLMPLLFSAEGLWIAGVGLAMYGANKASPYVPGTGAYADRQIAEQYQALQTAQANKEHLANLPFTPELRAAPPQSWWSRQWGAFKEYMGYDSFRYQTAPRGQTTINIYARDAQEAAGYVRQAVNQPTNTKYVNSRMPVAVEE